VWGRGTKQRGRRKKGSKEKREAQVRAEKTRREEERRDKQKIRSKSHFVSRASLCPKKIRKKDPDQCLRKAKRKSAGGEKQSNQLVMGKEKGTRRNMKGGEWGIV